MNPSHPSGREKAIFEQALDLPSAEARLDYVKGACGTDDALLARVETLLRAHEAPGGFLPEHPGMAANPTVHHAMPESAEKPGTVIGRYKLLEKVGEGGFGSVYMAEQEVPVHRRVALKVIKLGMDTKEVVTRFEAERQALAMMDHPNIAKVLDAGATETGRPYFVMELVKGVPITTYCDQRQLSTPARLELFILVCQAVQHAHQKGIIHRDLKPSNILVTEQDDRPVPKVIDFGVARATQARLTEKTMFTQFHQMVGTPAYMSPEQTGLANLDIDTRSDIYSLGVLLYELLTGCTPFDPSKLLEAGYEGIMRIIREVEPPKPSTRLSSLSMQELTALGGRRLEEPRRLGRLVQGDLDWIVMKALEKDRARRYETASSLAQDLQRHLSNEPVVARPASNLYRFRKWARRNRLVFTAGSAIAAALLVGATVATWQAVRARSAERMSRLRAYASDINLAQQAIANLSFVRAAEILEGLKPPRGADDLRGWEWRFLWQQCRNDVAVVVNHWFKWSYGVRSVAISHDGAWVAFGTAIEGVTIRNVATKATAAQLHVGNWCDVVFSPTEPLLALAGNTSDGQGNWTASIKLWDARTSRIVREIPLAGVCRSLAFSSDGRSLLALRRPVQPEVPPGEDALVVFDVGTGRPIRPPMAMNLAGDFRHKNPQTKGSIDDPGTDFAASLVSGVALLPLTDGYCALDLATGRRLWTVATDPVNGHPATLALSADGKLAAACDRVTGGTIRLHDSATGREIGRLAGAPGRVSRIAFMPDGQTLVTAHGDMLIRVWDVPRLALTGLLRGHTYPIFALAVCADDRTLVSGGDWESEVFVWKIAASNPPPIHLVVPAPAIHPWKFGPEGRSILTAVNDGPKLKLLSWSGRDFRENETLSEIPFTAKSAIQDAMESLTPASRFEVDFRRSTSPFVLAWFASESWLDHVRLTFSASAPSRAPTGTGTQVTVTDRASKKTVAAFIFNRINLRFGFVSDDGRRLAVCADGSEPLKLFDVESGRELLSLGSGLADLSWVQFSPNDGIVGARSGDGLVHLWTAPSWAEITAAEKSAASF